jgi:type VI protein secretion system component Hcp
MANNAGADIFLILLRPTRVPVAGEAVSHLFQGQVHIESLSWNLHNEDERQAGEAADDEFRKAKDLVDRSGSMDLRIKHANEDLNRQQARRDLAFRTLERGDDDAAYEKEFERYQRDRNEIYKDYQDKIAEITTGERQRSKSWDDIRDEHREKQVAEAERNRNFEFTFTKRVDIASTQMLNSMKAGDIFPSGTLTIHKRSSTMNDGTSLVFTIQKVRLLDYQLQVVVTDTMTEMMEEWTCEFGSLAYVYKNPPSHYSNSGAGQAAVKAATQGTMRAFTMKNIGSPI